MQKKYAVGFVGAGFMATAVIEGILRDGFLKPHDIAAADMSEEALKRISEKGIYATKDIRYIADNSEFLFFAVKPQNFADVVNELSGISVTKFISILAGVKKEKYYCAFEGAKVARCMPNTPCSVGKGTVGLDISDFSGKDAEFVFNIFKSVGDVVMVKEEQMDAVTGISGSGPAYVYLFIDSLVNAGIESGLDERTAKQLAIGTVKGAVAMVESNPDKSLQDLIKAVCSKGGTTIEAMNVFEKENFKGIVREAVKACVKRSKELSSL